MIGAPPSRLGLGVPVDKRMRVKLLGARYYRWLNRAGKTGLHSRGVSVGEAGSSAHYSAYFGACMVANSKLTRRGVVDVDKRGVLVKLRSS